MCISCSSLKGSKSGNRWKVMFITARLTWPKLMSCKGWCCHTYPVFTWQKRGCVCPEPQIKEKENCIAWPLTWEALSLYSGLQNENPRGQKLQPGQSGMTESTGEGPSPMPGLHQHIALPRPVQGVGTRGAWCWLYPKCAAVGCWPSCQDPERDYPLYYSHLWHICGPFRLFGSVAVFL